MKLKVKHIVAAFVTFFTLIAPWTIKEEPNVMGVISMVSTLVFIVGVAIFCTENWNKPIQDIMDDTL